MTNAHIIIGGGSNSEGSFTAGGDLSGDDTSQTVIGLQGRDVASDAPSDGYALVWDEDASAWTPTELATGSFMAGGDLSGSDTSQTVEKINGASVPAAGELTTNHVLKVSGASATSYGYVTNDNIDASAAIAYSKLDLDDSIVDADINDSAAIDGTKVSPDFGSQNITTTGALKVGSTPASAGTIRLPNTGSILARNPGDTANVGLLSYGADEQIRIGGVDDVAAGIVLRALGNFGWYNGTAYELYCDSGAASFLRSIAIGSNPASSGILRIPNNQTIYARNATNDGNVAFGVVDASNNLLLGDLTTVQAARLWGGNSCGIAVAGSQYILLTTGGTLDLAGIPYINLDAGIASPRLKQNDDSTNSATGDSLTIQAQNATGTTSTGGALVLTSGTGTSTNGATKLQVGGTDVLTLDTTTHVTYRATETKQIISSWADGYDITASVDTDDDTTTNLYTWTIQDNATTTVDVRVVCNQDSSAAGDAWVGTITFRRDGGTVSVVDAADVTQRGATAFVLTLDNSTSTGRVRVTGATDTNLNWAAQISLLVVREA